VLPESVTSVGSGALRGCTGLKKLTVLCDPTILPDDLLEGCGALDVSLAEESVMTLTEDGSLCVEEEGVKIYFLREKRDPQPEENAAAPAGCASAEY